MTSARTEKRPPTDVYSLAGDYNYDLQFTADISKQMQMPERLAAVDDMRKMNHYGQVFADCPAFGMTMPDKIILGESDYSAPPDDEILDDAASGYYSTEQRASSAHSSVNGTPQKNHNHAEADMFAAGELVVPATPASMLQSSIYGRMSAPSSDVSTEWTAIQRHVAKLTCRIERLEEENGRRRQRELLLYPLVIGYCILQFARLFLVRSR